MILDLRTRYAIWKTKRIIARCDACVRRMEVLILKPENADSVEVLRRYVKALTMLSTELQHQVDHMKWYLQIKKGYRELEKSLRRMGWKLEARDREEAIEWLETQGK